jgi:hypothetical protein
MHPSLKGRTSSRRFPLVVGFALFAGPASAEATVDVEIELKVASYRAEETLPGGFVFNREEGTLPGLTLAVGQSVSNWAYSLGFDYYGGSVGYEGFTQVGLPLTTRTDLDIGRLRAEVGPGTDWPLGVGSLDLRVGLSYAWIRRGIQPARASLALTETMRWTDVHANLNWRIADGPWAFSAGATVAWPIAIELEVASGGVFDNYALKPGRELQGGWRVAVQRELPSWGRLELAVADEILRFGASEAVVITRAGVPAAISSYPGSKQSLLNLSVGWQLRF